MPSLRDVTAADLELVRRWRNRPEVRNAMYTTHEIGAEEHAAWFARVERDPSKRNYLYLDDDVPRGVVAFTELSPERRTGSWAFYAGEDAPRGLGTAMETLALRHAFTELHL